MALNLIKTVFGYGLTLLQKHTPLSFERNSIEGIYNYLPIRYGLSTSGQPTEKQMALIKQAGFTHVINLAPHHVENALKDEAATLEQLGLRYIHIPVDFKAPTDANFQKFVNTMEVLADENVWVHCAANMRVSAFIYRYRCEVLKEDAARAKRELHKIWKPIGVWQHFVSAADQ